MPAQAAFHDQRDKTASHLRSESEELLLALIAQTGIQLQTAMDSRFRPLGLTAQEAALLIRCAEAKSRSSGELASVIGRDKGGVTRHLDKLEARGYIERFASSRPAGYPGPRDSTWPQAGASLRRNFSGSAFTIAWRIS